MPTATLAAACVALLIFVGSTPMLDGDNEPASFVDEVFNASLTSRPTRCSIAILAIVSAAALVHPTDCTVKRGLSDFRFPPPQQVQRWTWKTGFTNFEP